MRTSFFTELMNSYAGIRKRTWKPTYVLVEEFDPTPEQTQAVQGIDAAFSNALAGTAAAQLGQNGNISFAPDPDNPGKVIIQAAGKTWTWDKDQYGVNSGHMKLNHGSSNIRQLIGIWAPKQPETRSGDAPQGEGEGDTETGFVEVDDPEQEQRDNRSAEVKKEVQGDNVKFEQHHRDSMMEFLTNPVAAGGQGLSKEEAEAQIAQMEYQVNTPYSNTNVYYGLAMCLGTRPDFGPEVKKEVLAAVGELHEVVSKIKTITVNGKDVRVINEKDLRGCMGQAAAITTVRGVKGDKGVFIGRGSVEYEEDDECFGNLQEFTAQYDHQEYGSTFGRVLNPMAQDLMDVVVLPSGADIPSIEPKDIEAWRKGENGGRLLTRRSVSVEKSADGDNMINNYVGKVVEDIFELIGSNMAGNEEGKTRAIERLKKHLAAGASMVDADLSSLETVLLGDEFLLLQELQKFEDLGIPPNESLRMLIQQAAVHAQNALIELGLSENDVIRMENPSNDSKIGYKSDMDVILSDDAVVNAKWRDAVWDRKVLDKNNNPVIDPETGEEVTERVLSISIKFYESLNSKTVVGSCSLFKAYGAGASDLSNTKRGKALRDQGRAEADTLHKVCLDDLRSSGSITPEQEKSMQDAIDADRAEWQRLEAALGSFAEVDNTKMEGHINAMLDALPAAGSEEETAGDIYKRKELEGIRRSFEKSSTKSRKKSDKGKGDRTAGMQAAQKLWQLGRMVRAQKDPEYAKAMALNDMIMSSQTYEPEIQLKGSTGRLRLDNNRHNLRAVARACFADSGRGSSSVTGTAIYGWNEDAGMEVMLFQTGLRAKTTKTGRKQIAEGIQTVHGARLTATESMSRVGKNQPIPPSDEENEEDLEDGSVKAESQEPEEELVSNFQPILDNLPAIETGEVQRMGNKLIAILKPYCLKVKCRDGEYEGGFMSKEEAEKAFHLIKQLAVEFDEKVDVKVKDYKWHRTFS